MARTVYNDLEIVTVTIGSGASLSDAAQLGQKSLVAILMPATWTAADLTFQGSIDGSAFAEIAYTSGDAAVAVAALQVASPAAGQLIIINPDQLLGVSVLKVRSGTSGTPVNQGGDRTVTLVLRRRD